VDTLQERLRDQWVEFIPELHRRRIMPRYAKPLSARKVQTAGPGRFYDGDGLILYVRQSAGTTHGNQPPVAFWVYRYTLAGRTREAGLGRARGPNSVSLAAARTEAAKLRAIVKSGRDPLAERKAAAELAKADAARAKVNPTTFKQVADRYLAAHEAGWCNPKHRQQWRKTLRDYVLPTIGGLPVASCGGPGGLEPLHAKAGRRRFEAAPGEPGAVFIEPVRQTASEAGEHLVVVAGRGQ
jgi:hypothetical protein